MQIGKIIEDRLSSSSSRTKSADHPGLIRQIGLIEQIVPSRSCSSSRADRADRADHLNLDCSIFFLPDAWVVSGTSQPIKKSSSGSPNKSTDISFAPASAPQGLREAHGLHLLVCGAGVLGWIKF